MSRITPSLNQFTGVLTKANARGRFQKITEADFFALNINHAKQNNVVLASTNQHIVAAY